MDDSTSASSSPQPSSGYRPYTSGHFRNRRHASASEAAEHFEQELPRVQHPLISHGAPEFVDRQEHLDELVQHLRQGPFAYDSEFIGERTYVPQLCLIQVASAQRVALIDTLAELDLSGFWQLLCDPAVEKVVHAGEQDVEPVFRNRGCPAANIFDTQIAAGLIGLAYPVALAKLVRATVGARLVKGQTVTQWDQRPLSPMQLRYAADDVRYLLAIREHIGQQLAAAGHTAWARAECDALCDPAQYGFNATTGYQRIRGSNGLPPRNQAVLRALTVWRDARAREHNIPSRTFLRDEVLLDLARSPVKSPDKLARMKGLPRPLVESYGSELIAVIAAGLNAPTDDLPVPREIEPTPRQRFVADALWSTVQCLCAGRGIDPNLVSSRQDIGQLYHAMEEGRPTGDVRLLQGWRRQAAGQTVLDLLEGKVKAELEWCDVLKSAVMAKP